MKPYMRPYEDGLKTREHGEPTILAPEEENAIKPSSVSAVPRFLLLFSINMVALAASLFIMAAIVVSS